MDDLIRHGMEARVDWRAYYTVFEEPSPRYHNRPDCADGAEIEDRNIREGTDNRPLCDKCHAAEHPTE